MHSSPRHHPLWDKIAAAFILALHLSAIITAAAYSILELPSDTLLYRKAQTRWKARKEHRNTRRIIAEFDHLHPELKDKYTDYGKRQFMSYKKMFEIFTPSDKQRIP